ncbi:4-hydroxythreonine-4-phosphate dehydrogenase PdxA [Pannus brasiliensis CCIBt3594]|uniref:4-hydroxythreonine-4-phosphate dehydrogenase n=1 Tax=Pannus brasiliensis CCIBt3594 TaxID=1427578 RepID=A0AAW9QFH5_9CHRO
MAHSPSSLPRLVIPIGDPAGIGPEVVLKSIEDPVITRDCQIALIGTRAFLPNTDFPLFDIPYNPEKITVGKGDAYSGEISFLYLQEAIKRTLAGEFDGIVTAPIAKSCWKQAGYDFPGQTEVLAGMAGIDRYGMLFVARSPRTGWTLRTLLATTHIPLKDVPTALNPELMTRKLELLLDCLAGDFGITNPSIAIAGLNPHSGEAGQLGTEEKDWLNAWLDSARQKYPNARLIGLIPPDTMWLEPGRAWFEGGGNPADAYLALYHDQGLIPVKLMAFDRAVNTTIGLPFIRTSPDHGTAFDIAGKGIARADSMKAAIQLAAELCRQRSSGDLD